MCGYGTHSSANTIGARARKSEADLWGGTVYSNKALSMKLSKVRLQSVFWLESMLSELKSYSIFSCVQNG